MQQRRVLDDLRMAQWPNLTVANHQVTSDEDPDYNCAAWAIHDTTHWWWPNPNDPECQWPEGIRRDLSLGSLIDGFQTFGFEVCDSPDQGDGYETIAVYVHNGLPAHVARLAPSGAWASKLGGFEDIEHDSLDCVDDGSWDYGAAQHFMRRRLAG